MYKRLRVALGYVATHPVAAENTFQDLQEESGSEPAEPYRDLGRPSRRQEAYRREGVIPCDNLYRATGLGLIGLVYLP
jgi:hypothetical protein